MSEFEEAKAVADPEVEVSGSCSPEKSKIKRKMRPTPLIALGCVRAATAAMVATTQYKQWT